MCTLGRRRAIWQPRGQWLTRPGLDRCTIRDSQLHIALVCTFSAPRVPRSTVLHPLSSSLEGVQLACPFQPAHQIGAMRAAVSATHGGAMLLGSRPASCPGPALPCRPQLRHRAAHRNVAAAASGEQLRASPVVGHVCMLARLSRQSLACLLVG